MKQIYGIVFLILVLLLAVGCRKQPKISSQPELETPAAEETIAEPVEEPEQESVAPDLGNVKELLEVLQTLQTQKDWKNSPEYEMITAQKEKVLSQLIGSFYHGLDSLSLQNTAFEELPEAL